MSKQNESLNLIIYVGTKRLAGMLAETSPGRVRMVGFGEIQNPDGFQKGGVSHLEKAVTSVGELSKRLNLGEEAVEIPTYILVSSPHLKLSRFTSSVYYSGYPRVVTSHEVRQAIEQTRSVAPLSLEDWILQVFPESFWVNDLTGVQDPIGLEAQRLAVTLQIFSTNYASFRNLSRVFETLEFNVKGYFPKTYFLPEGVLNANEREGEALLIDFSDEVTHLVLTREGKIVQTKSFDFGSRLLTTKIAETWQIGLRDAERLKERFGSLEQNPQFGEELIPLIERNGQKNHQIKRAEFHQKFFRFGEELFNQIEAEAEALLLQEKTTPHSIILTGGGVRLEGLPELFGRRFSSHMRLGTARQMEGAPEHLLGSEWCGPVGLLGWVVGDGKERTQSLAGESFFERALVQAKEWLAAYF